MSLVHRLPILGRTTRSATHRNLPLTMRFWMKWFLWQENKTVHDKKTGKWCPSQWALCSLLGWFKAPNWRWWCFWFLSCCCCEGILVCGVTTRGSCVLFPNAGKCCHSKPPCLLLGLSTPPTLCWWFCFLHLNAVCNGKKIKRRLGGEIANCQHLFFQASSVTVGRLRLLLGDHAPNLVLAMIYICCFKEMKNKRDNGLYFTARND